MGSSSFLRGITVLVLAAGLLLLPSLSLKAQTSDPVFDSTELSQDSIFICENHFFEWCTMPSYCAHCNESLQRISLWDYYQKLVCEECRTFFIENYHLFKPGI